MSSIKVVDVNNEEAKQEEAIEQPIEEAKEEVNEIVEEPPQETANGSLNSNSAEVETKEVIEETQKQPAGSETVPVFIATFHMNELWLTW